MISLKATIYAKTAFYYERYCSIYILSFTEQAPVNKKVSFLLNSLCIPGENRILGVFRKQPILQTSM
ncbi:hypothetical protein D3H55_08265 [Bacillus salacetis]|uniref:Uncharacterized protein n=1 Tax=Bacillus salacetis TaxID=2315464 RepID=A0A3A1R001_9BACI|nr:hypothetical protein D3H55_08265 [Bacillus salacetis]